jgi:hypothetical protein
VRAPVLLLLLLLWSFLEISGIILIATAIIMTMAATAAPPRIIADVLDCNSYFPSPIVILYEDLLSYYDSSCVLVAVFTGVPIEFFFTCGRTKIHLLSTHF